jgi:hypothetical protein
VITENNIPQCSLSTNGVSAHAGALESLEPFLCTFYSGDGYDAYAYLSQRCRDEIPLSEYVSASDSAHTLVGSVSQSGLAWVQQASNAGRGNQTVQYVSYYIVTRNVESKYVGFHTTDQWVLEDGAWRVNNCSLTPGLEPAPHS